MRPKFGGQKSMTVGELIEELQRAPQDAVPVVGGEVIQGVLLKSGAVSSDVCPKFSAKPGGRHIGLIFLVKTDMANGIVKRMPR